MIGLKPPAKKRKTIAKVKEIRQASKFLSSYLLECARAADQEARWFLAMYGLRQGEALGMTDDCLDGRDARKWGRRIIVKQQLQRISAEHSCELDHATGKWSCGRTTSNRGRYAPRDPYPLAIDHAFNNASIVFKRAALARFSEITSHIGDTP